MTIEQRYLNWYGWHIGTVMIALEREDSIIRLIINLMVFVVVTLVSLLIGYTLAIAGIVGTFTDSWYLFLWNLTWSGLFTLILAIGILIVSYAVIVVLIVTIENIRHVQREYKTKH